MPFLLAGAVRRSIRCVRALQSMRASMTQDELAQAVRKSRRWVHDLESGKVNLSLGAAIDVAAALGATISLEPSERSDVLDEIFEDL